MYCCRGIVLYFVVLLLLTFAKSILLLRARSNRHEAEGEAELKKLGASFL